jgi:ABC-type iron transport system FetAB ATPase subunit
MPSENDGVMIVLSSPSGAGKTTLVKMLSKMDNYEISISDNILTNVVLQAPDGEDKTIITPSISDGI